MSTSLPAHVPPLLYVPCLGWNAPPADPEVVVRRTRDGRTAVVAYTALDRLRRACGNGQPWRLLALDGLQRALAGVGLDVLYLDLVMPPHLRVDGPEPDPTDLPPVLYAPCTRHVARVEDAALTYLRGEDGLVGLPLWTSLDRLHGALGRDRPWVVVETARLEDLHRLAPYDRILLDEHVTATGTEGAWG